MAVIRNNNFRIFKSKILYKKMLYEDVSQIAQSVQLLYFEYKL